LLQESSRQNYLAAFITWLSPIGHHEEVFSGEAYAAIVLKPLHKYGYPIRWLVIFMAAVGLPLPTSLVLLAAGAFAAHGDFNIALLMGITIAAASCGDSVGYFIGRCWGSKTLDWLGKPRRLNLFLLAPLHARATTSNARADGQSFSAASSSQPVAE
jgi:membrane protein DedA with SNARE-associated domain